MESRRLKFRKDLHPLYLPVYDGLCEHLPEDWQPFSGLRTFAEQTKLYEQGRSAPGHIVTKAQAGESAHNYGCASDWILWVDGKPSWIGSKNARWEEYWNACDKVGAKKGKDFGDHPHNELALKVSWKRVHEAYEIRGILGAIEVIWEERVK